jgi:hypothetical protein
MGRHRFVLAVSAVFTAVAVFLWGLSLDDGSQVSRVIIGGAIAAAVIAALLWVALWIVVTRERAERMRAEGDHAQMNLVIRTLSAVAPDGPLPQAASPRPTAPLHLAPWRE